MQIWNYKSKFLSETSEIPKVCSDLFSTEDRLQEVFPLVIEKFIEQARFGTNVSEIEPSLKTFLAKFSDNSPEKLKKNYEKIGVNTVNFSPILFDENISMLAKGSDLEVLLAQRLTKHKKIFHEGLEDKPYWKLFEEIFDLEFYHFAQKIADQAIRDNFALAGKFHEYIESQRSTDSETLEKLARMGNLCHQAESESNREQLWLPVPDDLTIKT